MIYIILSTILFILAILIIHWIHNQYHMDIVVTPAPPPVNAPKVSVCIPARNEETNIRRCVEAVLRQDYPNFEVIVLDDRSADSTLTLLKDIASRDSRLLPVSGSDLPEGWAGKPHALYQAASVARGEWLCFVDADTFLEPFALSSVYAETMKQKADLFTVITNQILVTFWERVIMPLVLTALTVGFSPRKVNDPKRTDAISNGQFIFIKRSAYDAIGGHESVKDRIAEDQAIAHHVKSRGFRLIFADGTRAVSTRMYTSFAGIWEGWTKNIYLGLSIHPGLLALGAFGALLGFLAAFFLPVWIVFGFAWFANGGGMFALAVTGEALCVTTYLLFMRVRAAGYFHIPAWYAFTTFLGAGIFSMMILASAWKVLSGQGVTWRGRKYKLNQ
ncbi:MAG: glycosyltransferase [Anaerolineales bacterium]|jgi:chlorobactene glucosyltransferase|nr:glycosyltransferase [Anaerolineales bacterium]